MSVREPIRSQVWEFILDVLDEYPATSGLVTILVIALIVVTVVFWSVAWIIWLCVLGFAAFVGLMFLVVTALEEW